MDMGLQYADGYAAANGCYKCCGICMLHMRLQYANVNANVKVTSLER